MESDSHVHKLFPSEPNPFVMTFAMVTDGKRFKSRCDQIEKLGSLPRLAREKIMP